MIFNFGPVIVQVYHVFGWSNWCIFFPFKRWSFILPYLFGKGLESSVEWKSEMTDVRATGNRQEKALSLKEHPPIYKPRASLHFFGLLLCFSNRCTHPRYLRAVFCPRAMQRQSHKCLPRDSVEPHGVAQAPDPIFCRRISSSRASKNRNQATD